MLDRKPTMLMAKQNMPPKTPFNKFTEAASRLFNLPKDQKDKVIEVVPKLAAKKQKH